MPAQGIPKTHQLFSIRGFTREWAVYILCPYLANTYRYIKMSLINEYRATEDAIKELQARLANLQQDEGLKKEMEFEEKLRALMGHYSKSLKDIIGMLDPQAGKTRSTKPAADKTPRRARQVKQYKNPHNGEVIETKGGNHRTLKEWKEKWGGPVVEGWVTLLD